MCISPETWLSPHHVATSIHGGGRTAEALSRAGQLTRCLPLCRCFLYLLWTLLISFVRSFLPRFFPFLIISDAVLRPSKTARPFEDEAQDLAAASLECKTEAAVANGGFRLRQPEDRLGTPFNPAAASKGSSSGTNSGFSQHKYRHRKMTKKI